MYKQPSSGFTSKEILLSLSAAVCAFDAAVLAFVAAVLADVVALFAFVVAVVAEAAAVSALDADALAASVAWLVPAFKSSTSSIYASSSLESALTGPIDGESKEMDSGFALGVIGIRTLLTVNPTVSSSM